MSEIKEKDGHVNTQVSEVIENCEDSDHVISILVKQKSKQNEKLHPTRVYLENLYTYNHI